MKKVIVILVAALFVMGAGLALASPKVAGLSQKGSVLVFPKIDTTPGNETYVLLSNDNNQPVSVYCNWIVVTAPAPPPLAPECITIQPSELAKFPIQQTPTDSLFTLTPFQPVMVAASTGYSPDPITVTINAFGAGNEGYLACWAVDFDGTSQINFNHLSGMAYVLNSSTNQGYSYPAWAFQALSGAFKAPVGTAGSIKFNAIEFDAMPQYLLFTFPTIGTSAGGANIFKDIQLTLLPGKQNFTNMTLVHTASRAIFDVWNENEARYSGGSKCMWCYWDELLSTVTLPGTPPSVLFADTTLHTTISRVRLNSIASTTCLPQLTQEQIEGCIGVNTVLQTAASPLIGFAIQQIGPAAGPFLYETTNLPVGVAQDYTATFEWKHY